ncbi:MAG: CopG family transcriptional regulator [Desulfobacterales bacterium]|nr:MAG: CopG family transcriptional regulator [Desulfobacterales bacterium]
MGQVTIYLDSETEKKLHNIVRKSGVSKSKWIADLIKEKTSHTWPDHISELAGAWKDLPTVEEIRAGMGEDAKREPL